MKPLPRNGEVIITIKDCVANDWRELRHGRWLRSYNNKQYKECSVCGKVFSVNLPCDAHYCPNCGARMDLEDEDDGKE